MKIISCLANKRETLGFQIDLEHGRGCYLLLHFLTPVEITIDGKEVSYNKNVFILYNKNDRTTYSSKRNVMYNSFILFDEEIENELASFRLPINTPFYLNEEQSEKIYYLWDELAFLFSMNDKLVHDRFISLLSFLANCQLKLDEPSNERLKFEKIREEFYTNPGKLSIQDASKKIFYSRVIFTRIYEKYFGITPRNDLKKAKLAKAKDYLLYENYTIEEIANLLGYDNHANFLRFFKKETGMTPSTYLKTYKK